MQPFSSHYISWITFAVAVVLWAAVGYFVWTISSASKERLARIVAKEQEATMYDEILRLRSIARETEGARRNLEEFAGANVVEVLDTVEALSYSVGAPVKIGQALSTPANPISPINTASFLVETSGTFSQMTHAAALLETLPLSTSLEELHLELVAMAGGKSSWHLVARIRFLTTFDFSS